MTTTLLILAHVADAAPFADALASRDDAAEIELRPLVVNGMSAAYHALAASLRDKVTGRLLPALLRHVRASRPVSGYERIVFVSWSAPYAMLQSLATREDDAAALAGAVLLDSGYGPVTPGEVAMAKRARRGEAILWSGATDVPTHGYASSRAHLADLCRQAGEPTGGLHVELWEHDPAALHAAADKGAYWRAEHIAALRRGPAFVVRALAALDAMASPRVSEPPSTLPTGGTPPSPPRGARALQAALNAHGASPRLVEDGDIGPLTRAALVAFQRAHGLPATGVADVATWDALTATEAPQPTIEGVAPASVGLAALAIAQGEVGVHETPGPGTTARVAEYLSGCARSGRPLGLVGDEPAWCASLIGWCEHTLQGALPWRAAVSEVYADALAVGATRERSYHPAPGDLAVFARAGGDPRRGGPGHVARVEVAPDASGAYVTIGGNEGGAQHHGGAVLRTKRNVSDPSLVGWIVRT